MTKKQTEKLRRECSKYGMDFDYGAIEDDVKMVVRFIKKSRLDRNAAREQLFRARCHSVEHLQCSPINFDWDWL